MTSTTPESPTSSTHSEIRAQPAAVAEAIDVAADAAAQLATVARGRDHVFITGCGSTFHASVALRAAFAIATGLPVTVRSAGDLLLEGREVVRDDARPLVVAISRSGATTETVESVSHLRQRCNAATLVITTDPNSDLAAIADVGLNLPIGSESSVVQTKSFSAMLTAGHCAAAIVGGGLAALRPYRGLPDLFAAQIDGEAASRAEAIGRELSLSHFVFLGSSDRIGLASEGALKMQEMSLSSTDVATFLEFRHGPMAMVDSATHVTGIVTSRWHAHERRVLDELEALGATSTSIGSVVGADVTLPGLPIEVEAILSLPFLQLLAFHRSVANGCDPDAPRHLTQVIVRDFESNAVPS